MLESCGFQSFDEMYACIPEELRLKKPLQLPEGKGGSAVIRKHPQALRTLAVEDAYELKDADTAEDLEALRRR